MKKESITCFHSLVFKTWFMNIQNDGLYHIIDIIYRVWNTIFITSSKDLRALQLHPSEFCQSNISVFSVYSAKTCICVWTVVCVCLQTSLYWKKEKRKRRERNLKKNKWKKCTKIVKNISEKEIASKCVSHLANRKRMVGYWLSYQVSDLIYLQRTGRLPVSSLHQVLAEIADLLPVGP